MKLSVIMPVYNEERTLRKILDKVRSVKIKKEIIIVDDGSTDGTEEILKDIEDNNVKVICHTRNMGKGTAIRTGLKQVTGDIVIIQDADLEYDPEDYHRLIEPIVSGKAKVVYGSRPLGRMSSGIKPTLRYYSESYRLGNKFLTLLANLLYHTRITDLYTCYKAFRAEVLKNAGLHCKGFEFCPEVTAKIRKQGHKIREVPISYHARIRKEGKKISWRDGLKGLYTLIRYRFID